jgi:hypothetical protein
MSQAKINMYMNIAYAGLEKPDADAWNKRVDQIRDALAKGTNAGQSSEIDDDHLVLTPIKSIMLPGARNNDNLKTIRKIPFDVRSFPYVKPFTPNVQLRLTQQNGGNNNPHAPLYPNITMNGGAHPLATLDGGAYTAEIIIPKTKSLLERLNGLTKGSLEYKNIASRVDNEETVVKNAAEVLQNDIKDLQNMATGIAYLNPGVGIDISSMNKAELDKLAKKGEEINKKAERLSRRVTKLDEITDLLTQLVKNQSPFGAV